MLCNGLNISAGHCKASITIAYIADNEVQWMLHFSDDNLSTQHHFRCGMHEVTTHNNYLQNEVNKQTHKIFGIFNWSRDHSTSLKSTETSWSST